MSMMPHSSVNHEQAIDAYTAQYNDTQEDTNLIETVTDENTENQMAPAKSSRKKRASKKSKSTAISVLNRDIDLKSLAQQTYDQKQSIQAEKTKKELTSRFKKEYQTYLKETHQRRSMTSSNDQITLSHKAVLNNTKKKKTAALQTQSTFKNTATEKILHRYIHHFSEELIQDSPQKREKSKVVKQQLLTAGVSPKQIKQTERQVQRFIHSDVKKQIRNRFLNLSILCESKKFSVGLFENYNEFNNLKQLAEHTGVFGEGRSSLKQEKELVKSELSNFVAHELDHKLIETRLNTHDIDALKNTFNQLNSLSRIAQFNVTNYIQHIQTKLDHLGLNHFVAPPLKGAVDTHYSGHTKKNSAKKKKSTLLGDANHEEDNDLETELRSLYIRQYTTPSMMTRLKLKLKIMRHKSHLSDYNNEICTDTILAESKQLAKLRLSFMLREAFEERATLPLLSGPEYRLIKRKIKFVLKNLKSLGSPLSRFDRDTIRDQSNRSMFTLIKEDYVQLEVHLESSPKNVILTKKRDELLQILNRLKKETKINETVKPKLMQDMNFLSDISITEAA